MKNHIILITACMLMAATVQAKEIKYAVADIPEALKQNAHTVYRVFNTEVEIKSTKSANVVITEARTILNKNGEENSCYMEQSSPMIKITSVKARIYDSAGKLVKTLGNSDLEDYSATSTYSLYEDNRIKRLDPKYIQYPFTVEYTSEISMNQTLFLPPWSHAPENTSFEKSSIKVITPPDFELRYKEYNITSPVSKTNEDGKQVYYWSLSNLKAHVDEPLADETVPDYPLVRFAPNDFEVGNTKGSAATWKDLGIWTTNLIEGKDILPESTIQKIKDLTATCKTDREKVKTIYEFMQQKTRYVSIQIGIGGWVPFDASTVDKFSYGDCKALSNYTKALLSSVGIKSYYCLVHAGEDAPSIDISFPSNQFNHAIVCVPANTDTIWLECTSQRHPAGFNGDFTDDRDVLLIDGENSKLVHTRSYNAAENTTNRKATINVSSPDNATCEVSTHYNGLAYEEALPLALEDKTDQHKHVSERIHIPSFTLNNCEYVEHKAQTPSYDEHLNISITNPVKMMTPDLGLLSLNLMNKLTRIPDKVRNRRTDFTIRRAELEHDTIRFQLPKLNQVAELPAKTEIQSKFGKYIAETTKTDEHTITYTRTLELYKGKYNSTEYSDFRDFLESISTADNAVASLKIKQ